MTSRQHPRLRPALRITLLRPMVRHSHASNPMALYIPRLHFRRAAIPTLVLSASPTSGNPEHDAGLDPADLPHHTRRIVGQYHRPGPVALSRLLDDGRWGDNSAGDGLDDRLLNLCHLLVQADELRIASA